MPALKPLIFDKFDGFAQLQSPNFLDIDHLNLGSMGLVEVNGGIITPIKTYTGAIPGTISPVDQIQIINGGAEGTILILRCQAAAMVDNMGNLRLRSNFIMDSPNDTLVLLRIQNGVWLELARSNND